MTVDTVTGEIVHELSRADARRLIDKIKGGVEAIGVLVETAYSQRAWVALGYESWDDLCQAEFAGARLRLPIEQRRDAVTSMRQTGMPTRAIGQALGIGQGTVRRDLATAPNGAVATVTSLDGRQRPATQPERFIARPEVVAQSKDESRRGTPIIGIGYACRDLIEQAGNSPELLVREAPDYVLSYLDDVPAALAVLTRISAAMETR